MEWIHKQAILSGGGSLGWGHVHCTSKAFSSVDSDRRFVSSSILFALHFPCMARPGFWAFVLYWMVFRSCGGSWITNREGFLFLFFTSFFPWSLDSEGCITVSLTNTVLN